MVKTIGVYGTQGIPPNTYSAGTMKEETSSLSRGESQAWEQKHGVRKKFKASLGYRVQPCLKKEKKWKVKLDSNGGMQIDALLRYTAHRSPTVQSSAPWWL